MGHRLYEVYMYEDYVINVHEIVIWALLLSINSYVHLGRCRLLKILAPSRLHCCSQSYTATLS